MDAAFFDNKASIVKDDLVARVASGDRIAIAASFFSLYAYQELKEQLESLKDFRFIYTAPTFLTEKTRKEAREFYIPRLNRERSLYGTDFEVKLRNELSQKAIAAECAKWIREKAAFKSFRQDDAMNTFLGLQKPDDAAVYMPFNGFTTAELGVSRSSEYTAVARMDTSSSQAFLKMFDAAWRDEARMQDVTDAVIESITTVYRENPPGLIYYSTLFNVFNEFLDDISEDVLPNEATGFKNSKIWGKLYDFQRDAALAIINKLETYNGCILADSVGLGKTFTALAVIKYYETRNRNVLVLCPKKLQENWMAFRGNLINNPIAEDRLRYDVVFHTDLSRTRGDTATGLPIDRINWGNYDLVVIDESHNFRNGGASSVKAEDKENRYEKLMNKVIKEGVNTKVLMLSATPVNNKFLDLKNQLALAYSGDPEAWQDRLKLDNDMDTVFRVAQTAFARWSKLPPDERTTKTLMGMLSFDFFEILDQVTVARSRKHIQRYYDMAALGSFPTRNKPLSKRPKLSTLETSINYHEIYEVLESLLLAVYIPSQYLLPSQAARYIDPEVSGITIAGRETGIRKLMNVNLLKRLESSVHSFRLTLERVQGYIAKSIHQVEEYERGLGGSVEDYTVEGWEDLDFDDEESSLFEVGRSARIEIADLDYLSWKRDMASDLEQLELLLSMIRDIEPQYDAKLIELCEQIETKMEDPINPGNRKVLVFTAFADTADYLYEHLSSFAKDNLNAETAIITGKHPGTSTIAKVPHDMASILACFSPISKERSLIAPKLEQCDIDILIGTDCISEGQNLQDCDYLINYDIHWNPVRIIQRFGRIDRIGSKNGVIQLSNYWPDVELDEYIKLQARVESRMRITVMTSTGDDDYINETEKGDLEYREKQLRQMRDEVIDLEDVSGGVSITDLGLNEFRMDLLEFYKDNPEIDNVPFGIHAVCSGEEPGVIFVLKNVNQGVNIASRNQLHPFYLVYVKLDGSVYFSHLEPKTALDTMRLLCKGRNEPDKALCKAFNKETANGRDMAATSKLLGDAIASMIDVKQQSDIESFFGEGGTTFLEGDIAGLNDFELLCFLVVR
ncbi:MAG: DEAD/DEAH box helicase family protein [Coriobacteriales bacterium]|nr:DEAD/DEAH box helicase family protein [Coriobacteriales bacterium]